MRITVIKEVRVCSAPDLAYICAQATLGHAEPRHDELTWAASCLVIFC